MWNEAGGSSWNVAHTMNKELLVRILDRIKSLSPGEVFDLTVEGAGVLQAFIEQRSKTMSITPAERAFLQKASGVLSKWESSETTLASTAQDKRTQVVLRGVIDKIQQDRWSELSEEDVQLLRGTKESLERRQSAGVGDHDRLIAMLTGALGKYETRQSLTLRLIKSGSAKSAGAADDDVEVIEGIPSGAGHHAEIKNRLNSKDAFQGGKAVRRNVIEGINAGRSVRYFEYTGETEIDGEIPADVHVNVKHAGVTITGMVAGCVTATNAITIRGNVQGGLVISKKGNIVLEGALVGSHVVAKSGSVTAGEVDAAQCIFGWRGVRVNGNVFAGKICGPIIEVTGNVGGELHCCGPATVHTMLAANRRTPAVACLYRQLTCEDYGQFMDKATDERRQRVAQLDVNIEAAEHMNRFAMRLARNCYRTALFYLLGGTENAAHAIDLQGLQTKSVHLRQVITIAEGVGRYYAGILERGRIEVDSLAAYRDENLKSLAAVRKEIRELPEEFGAIHIRYVADRCEELKGLIEGLHGETLDKRGTAFLGGVYHVRMSDWRGALGETDRAITEIVSKFGVDQAVIDRMEEDPEALPSMLDECIALQTSSLSIDDSKRAESPLIRLLKDSADRYFRSMKRGQQNVETAKSEYRDLRAGLMKESAVYFGDLAPGPCSVTAQAWETGAIITSSPERLKGYDTNMAETIVLAAPVTEKTTFRLKDAMVQRILQN